MELTNDFRVSAAPPTAWKVLTDVERIAPMLPGAQLQEIEGDEFRGIVKVKVGPITAQYKGTASFLERDETAGRVVLKAVGRDTRGQGNASATITATLTGDGDGTKVNVVTDLTVTGKVAQFGRGVLADVSAKLIGQFVDALEADLGAEGSGGSAPAPDAVATEAGDTGAGDTGAGDTGAGDTDDTVAASADPAGAVGALAEGDAPAPPEPDTGAVSPAAMVPETPTDTTPPGTASSVHAPDGSTAGTDAAPTPGGVRRINSPEPEPVDLLDAAGGSVAKRLLPVAGGLGALILLLLVLAGRRKKG